MKLNIQARLVAAIYQFGARNDIRYYLNGVYVEPIPGGGVLIVATNGHAMGMWRDIGGEVERPAILRIGKQLEAACAGSEALRLKIIDDRLVVVDKLGIEIFIQHHDGLKAGSWEIEGMFPRWEKVVPPSYDGPALSSALNARYVKLVHKALKIGHDAAGNHAITVMQKSAESSIAVLSAAVPDFFGVIMPIRENVARYPSWLIERQAALKVVVPPETAPVAGGAQTAEKPDPLYDKAVAVVAKEGKASISMMQRHLQIGWIRSARLLDRMHAEGKISDADDLDDVGFRKLRFGF